MILQVEHTLQNDPAVLSQLYVIFSNGTPVPLAAVASFSRKPQALTVNHQGQLPAVTVSFNLAPGVSLSDAVTSINNAMDKVGMPATISGSVQGTAQAFQQSMQGMGMLSLLAVFVLCLVLGILYESFILSLSILSGRGGRRAADPGDLSRLAGPVRVCRHRDDRYRQEERDHADRLCAGVSA